MSSNKASNKECGIIAFRSTTKKYVTIEDIQIR